MTQSASGEPPLLESATIEPASLVGSLTGLVPPLRAIGLVVTVQAPGEPDPAGAGSDVGPSAQVVALGWTDDEDGPLGARLRRVRFRLQLGVREHEPLQGLARLERLADAAIAAIDGAELGPGCLGALTRLRRGRYEETRRDRRQRLTLEGEFSLVRSTA